MTKTVRVGVMSPATIVKKMARAVAQADGVEIVAIGAERGLDQARDFMREVQEFLTPACKPVGSYDEVLEVENLDAVYIPMPSAKHMPWVAKAAAKGLHIMLEKPIAANMEDLQAICQAVEKHGVLMMDASMWLHNPRSRQMETVFSDTQKFGQVVSVNSTFTYNTDEDFKAKNIRALPEADPLGCLGDQGWYCVCAALWAYNCEPPEMVWAHPGATRNDKGVLMYLGATMIWPGVSPRRRAVIACGFDQCLTQSLEIWSPNAGVYLRDFVTPFKELKSCFVHTHDAKYGPLQTCVDVKRDEVWVDMPQAQEVYMWEEMATLIRRVRDEGAKPDKRWMEISRMTQQVLLAIEMSASKGNACVRVSDMQPVQMA